jgi:hypothetical protein
VTQDVRDDRGPEDTMLRVESQAVQFGDILGWVASIILGTPRSQKPHKVPERALRVNRNIIQP